MMKNFLFYLQSPFLSLTVRPDFLGHIGKWLTKEARTNFKIYDVISREANNYQTHIAQHLKK